MTSNVTRELYDIQIATDALAGSMTGLEATMEKYAKSKAWNVISRMSSGIMENFWSIQNKFRAMTIIFDEHFKKQRTGAEEALKSIESMVKVSDMASAMQPFEGLFDGSVVDLNEMDFLLEENLKNYKGIQEYVLGHPLEYIDADGNKIMPTDEELQEVQDTVRGLLQGQYDDIEGRKENIKKARDYKANYAKELKTRGIEKGEDGEFSYFSKLRIAVLRKQLKLNTALSKIKSFEWKNAISGAGKFFAKAFLTFAGIVLGLVVLKRSFDLLKEPLMEAFEDIKDVFGLYFNIIGSTLGWIGKSVSALIENFKEGDFLGVLYHLLIIGFKLILLAFNIVVGAFMVGFVTLGAILWRILEHSISSGKNFLSTLSAILMTIGVVAGYLLLIGSSIVSLPWLIIGGVLGGVGLLISQMIGFSSGGVVNSNMQLVGERGAELVSLPRGSRVHSNADSKRMMGGSGGNTINVNVSGRVGASDIEIRDIADKVAREINLRMNRTGSVVNNF